MNSILLRGTDFTETLFFREGSDSIIFYLTFVILIGILLVWPWSRNRLLL
jgi:hypothetical protein